MRILISDKELKEMPSRGDVKLECESCKKIFYRKKHIIQGLWKKHGIEVKSYCCNRCQYDGMIIIRKFICDFCGKIFERTSGCLPEGKHKFCSHSCSARFARIHSLNIKKPQGKCKKCGKAIQTRSRWCEECHPGFELWKEKTLGEIYTSAKYQKGAVIRQYARRIYRKSSKPKKCFVCGYNLHYDVAHIKPIATFSLNTKLKIINDLRNLVALCKNHHWEFDKKILKLAIPEEVASSSNL